MNDIWKMGLFFAWLLRVNLAQRGLRNLPVRKKSGIILGLFLLSCINGDAPRLCIGFGVR